MTANAFIRSFLLLLFVNISQPAWAQSAAKLVAVTNQFYAAISANQEPASMRASLMVILDDEAMIDLRDLDLVQTKSEFVDSLDEWADAIRGGFVAHTIMSVSDDTVVVSACYSFGESEVLNRDVFTVAAGKILKSVQTKIADNCENMLVR